MQPLAASVGDSYKLVSLRNMVPMLYETFLMDAGGAERELVNEA